MNPVGRIVSLLPDPRAYFQERMAHQEFEKLEREIDDTFINAAVKVAIYRDPEVRTAGIHVATSRSVVQLSGFVDSRHAMLKALEIARLVHGVKTVRNDMRLK
jgi:osmotically-inducible protein OsmY